MGGAVFTPLNGSWRLYLGEYGSGSWANQEVALTGIQNGDKIIIAYCIHEAGGKAANNQICEPRYATSKATLDAGSGTVLGGQTDTDKAFRMRNDPNLTDAGSIPTNVLSCYTESGFVHETIESSGYEDWSASAHREIWFVIEAYDVSPTTTYYFGIHVGGITCDEDSEITDYANLATAAGAISKGFSDTIDLDDVFAKITTHQFKSFSDSIGVSDVFTNPYRAMGFTDSIDLDDAFTIPFKAMVFSDSISMSDAFTNPFRAVAFADTISVSDTFAVLLRMLEFADTIGLSDAFEKEQLGVVSKEFSDSIGFSDAYGKAVTQQMKDFADSIGLSDAFSIPFKALNFTDTIAIADAFAVMVMKEFSDAIGMADVFTIPMKMFEFADAIGISDVFTTPYKEMEFADSIAIADTFGVTMKMLGFSDTIDVADVFSKITVGQVINKAFTDSISVVAKFHHYVRAKPTEKPIVLFSIPSKLYDAIARGVKKKE